MLDRMEREWYDWAASSRGRRHLLSWAADHPGLAGWPLEDLAAPQSCERTDHMQATLVWLAQRGDHKALLTLIVQLRPGVLRLVGQIRGRASRSAEPAADTVADVVGALTETIMTHSLARRPRLIASNLLLDTRQRFGRAERRAGRVRTDALTPSIITAPAGSDVTTRRSSSPEVVAERMAMVADLAAIIDDVATSAASRKLTAEVAFRAWFLDEPSDAIGAAVGLRPDAVRARLSRLRTAVQSRA